MYFYQDLDESGARLNGSKRYTVSFPAGQTPPVKGFWSLTMYDEYHFFVPNSIKRFSVGTKNKDLKTNADGSLTIYAQAEAPSDPAQRANWLPAARGQDFCLSRVRIHLEERVIGAGSKPSNRRISARPTGISTVKATGGAVAVSPPSKNPARNSLATD